MTPRLTPRPGARRVAPGPIPGASAGPRGRAALGSFLCAALVPLLFAATPAVVLAQASTEKASPTGDGALGTKPSALPLEPARTIEFTVDEGSWISVDVSPDGETIVFDLLGHLYTVPITGGVATRLTDGTSYNVQPRYSPDGERIAFVSDRSGGQNVWILTVATGELKQLTHGNDHLYTSPEWAPDGRYIVVSRATGPLGGAAKLWLYHVDGGTGAPLIREPESLKTLGAAFGKDGRYIWFAQRTGDWQYNAILPQYQLAVYDRRTGRTTVMSDRYGSAFRPTLSPDGRFLVYGTRHDAKTGLRIRDLETGEERWLAFPVQRDDQETRATLDVLPGMAFTPDSKALIASYDGGIWRIPVDGGEPSRIPFQATVSLGLGPEIRFEYRVDDAPTFHARQIRDAVPSPDGKRLAFTALNRVYVMDYPDGTPRRLTTTSDPTGEFGPVWSPDGRSIAFTTWSDDEGGHIWRVPAGGGRARRLTRVAALYRQLAWSPDGERLVAIRSASRDLYESPGLTVGGAAGDFVEVPASGGDVRVIAPTAGRHSPHFTSDPDRIFAFSPREGLVSFRWDGTDPRTHLRVTGPVQLRSQRPAEASLILISPTGEHAIAQVVNDLYVVTVPETGGPAPVISVANPDRAQFPVRRLTKVGGHFPAWSADGRRVHWSLGNAHFVVDLDAAAPADEGETRADADAAADAKGATVASGGAVRSAEPGPLGSAPPVEHRILVELERDLPDGVAVLRGARVITMRGDEVIEDADIVVRSNRIEAVGPRGRVPVPEGARIIDVAGKTIVPGFVDTHYHPQSLVSGVHTSRVWQYLATLAYGTTTTRDPQTGTADVLTYADRVETGELIGPRIFSTGPGVGNSEPVRSYDDAKDLLRRYSDYYDTKTLKMYMAGNRQQRQWIIMAARELGLMPTTEGGMDLPLDLTHVLDGYSGVEHNLPIVGLHRDVVELLARSGTVNTPTLIVSYGGPLAMTRFFTAGGLHDDPKLRRFHPHMELDRRVRRRGMGGTGAYGPAGWFLEDEYVYREHAEFLKRVVDAGGRIGVGGHGEFQGLGYHWEMWLLASGGLTPHQVLRAATLHGAEAIGLDRDIGSIEPGKLADLVVLDRNPLDDIRNTVSIRYVMKNGRLYDGETLDELWPRSRELPPLLWHGLDPVPGGGAEDGRDA